MGSPVRSISIIFFSELMALPRATAGVVQKSPIFTPEGSEGSRDQSQFCSLPLFYSCVLHQVWQTASLLWPPQDHSWLPAGPSTHRFISVSHHHDNRQQQRPRKKGEGKEAHLGASGCGEAIDLSDYRGVQVADSLHNPGAEAEAVGEVGRIPLLVVHLLHVVSSAEDRSLSSQDDHPHLGLLLQPFKGPLELLKRLR